MAIHGVDGRTTPPVLTLRTTCLVARAGPYICTSAAASEMQPGNRICEFDILLDPVHLENVLSSVEDHDLVERCVEDIREARKRDAAEAVKNFQHPCANSNPAFEGAEWRLLLTRSDRRTKCQWLAPGLHPLNFCLVCTRRLPRSIRSTFWRDCVKEEGVNHTKTGRLMFPCVVQDDTYEDQPWHDEWVQVEPCLGGRPHEKHGQMCTACMNSMVQQPEWREDSYDKYFDENGIIRVEKVERIKGKPAVVKYDSSS